MSSKTNMVSATEMNKMMLNNDNRILAMLSDNETMRSKRNSLADSVTGKEFIVGTVNVNDKQYIVLTNDNELYTREIIRAGKYPDAWVITTADETLTFKRTRTTL